MLQTNRSNESIRSMDQWRFVHGPIDSFAPKPVFYPSNGSTIERNNYFCMLFAVFDAQDDNLLNKTRIVELK